MGDKRHNQFVDDFLTIAKTDSEDGWPASESPQAWSCIHGYLLEVLGKCLHKFTKTGVTMYSCPMQHEYVCGICGEKEWRDGYKISFISQEQAEDKYGSLIFGHPHIKFYNVQDGDQ